MDLFCKLSLEVRIHHSIYEALKDVIKGSNIILNKKVFKGCNLGTFCEMHNAYNAGDEIEKPYKCSQEKWGQNNHFYE